MRFRYRICTLGLCLMMQFVMSCVSDARMFNPVTDMYFPCQGPMMIGGVEMFGYADAPSWQKISNPVCLCSNRFGLVSGMAQPSFLMEVTNLPYYSPTMDATLFTTSLGANLYGINKGVGTSEHSNSTFNNVHMIPFNPYKLAHIFLDFPCLNQSGSGLDYGGVGFRMSEIDSPEAADDPTALVMFPEAILFGNPLSIIALTAWNVEDGIASTFGRPDDTAIWNFGTWGSTYPLSNTSPQADMAAGAALNAIRFYYKTFREGTMVDPGLSACGPQLSFMMKKSNVTMNIAGPVVGHQCIAPGMSEYRWGLGKNPVSGGRNKPDNFLFILFIKTLCCLGRSYV